jgi:predicted membrane chloride channel (bestrophin family)
MKVYDPELFFTNIFDMHGSVIPKVLLRALLIGGGAGALAAFLMDQSGPGRPLGDALGSTFRAEKAHVPAWTTYFSVFIGFLLVFKTNLAHQRMDAGVALCGDLAHTCRTICSQACAYVTGDGVEAITLRNEICRLSLLMMVAVVKRVSEERNGEIESSEQRMLLPEEREQLQRVTQIDLGCKSREHVLWSSKRGGRRAEGGARGEEEEEEEGAAPSWRKQSLLSARGSRSAAARASGYPSAVSVGGALHEPVAPCYSHVPVIVVWLRARVQAAFAAGKISAPMQTSFDESISGFLRDFQALRKIADVPIPFPYAQMVKISLVLFILAAPFFVVADYRWAAVPLNFALSVVLLGIDEIAVEIEQPFGDDANDIDLLAVLRTVDVDISTMLAHRDHHERISMLFSPRGSGNGGGGAAANAAANAAAVPGVRRYAEADDFKVPVLGQPPPRGSKPFHHETLRAALRAGSSHAASGGGRDRSVPMPVGPGTINAMHASSAQGGALQSALLPQQQQQQQQQQQ